MLCSKAGARRACAQQQQHHHHRAYRPTTGIHLGGAVAEARLDEVVQQVAQREGGACRQRRARGRQLLQQQARHAQRVHPRLLRHLGRRRAGGRRTVGGRPPAAGVQRAQDVQHGVCQLSRRAVHLAQVERQRAQPGLAVPGRLPGSRLLCIFAAAGRSRAATGWMCSTPTCSKLAQQPSHCCTASTAAFRTAYTLPCLAALQPTHLGTSVSSSCSRAEAAARPAASAKSMHLAASCISWPVEKR